MQNDYATQWTIQNRAFYRLLFSAAVLSFRMLRWALIFLVVAIIAAALGFGGIAGTAAAIAKVLFYVFIIFFVLMLLAGLFSRGKM